MTMSPARLQHQPASPASILGARDARPGETELPAIRRRAAPPYLQSDALLQGQNSVSIQHNGAIYRLQATKLGKLILTK